MVKCPFCGNRKANIKFGIKRLRSGDFQQYQCSKCRRIWYNRRRPMTKMEVE